MREFLSGALPSLDFSHARNCLRRFPLPFYKFFERDLAVDVALGEIFRFLRNDEPFELDVR